MPLPGTYRQFARRTIGQLTAIFLMAGIYFGISSAPISIARASDNAKIKEYRERLAQQPSNWGLRGKLGRELFLIKDYNGCIGVMKDYADVVNRPAQYMLAQCYSETGKHDEALQILNLVLAHAKDDAQAYYKLAQELHAVKKNEEAILNYRKSIELQPKFKPAYDGLLKIFLEANNNYEQRAVVLDLIKQFGAKPVFIHRLCELYAKDGFLEEAVKACRKAISVDPTSAESHMYLGNSLYELQQTEEAEEILVRAAKKFPRAEPAQRAAGQLYFKIQNFTAAVRFLKRAVDLNPKSVEAMVAYAKATIETKDFKTALAYLKKACTIDIKVNNDFQVAAARVREKGGNDILDEFKGEAIKCRLSKELK